MYKLKLKGKKEIISILMFIIIFKMYSQVAVVTDPASHTHLLEGIAKTEILINKTQLQIDKFDDAAKKLSQVNNALSDSKVLLGIIKNIAKTHNYVNEISQLVNMVERSESRKGFYDKADEILDEIGIVLDLKKKLLANNLLEMKDGDRMRLLLDVYDRSKDLKNVARDLNTSIRMFIAEYN